MGSIETDMYSKGVVVKNMSQDGNVYDLQTCRSNEYR